MSLKEVPKSMVKRTQKKNNKNKGKSTDEKFSIKSHINNGVRLLLSWLRQFLDYLIYLFDFFTDSKISRKIQTSKNQYNQQTRAQIERTRKNIKNGEKSRSQNRTI